ncbi:FxSxx-COOH cyclophane-containing RiPP peptide [Dactylosporangium sp. NPDC049140]|uniref:FxSxx-COOH cyclophane-containing RiPP peptide n=1 Tax=unclassified Dactylosporangium TaxID=2621675 RepID=UPI0033E6D644
MKAGLVGDGGKTDTPDRLYAALTDLSCNPDSLFEPGLPSFNTFRDGDILNVFRDPARLAALGDGVLAHTIRRVLGEVEDPHETVAGFNSSL